MAHILTKRGAQDNIVTYEHMCDTHADLNNIPKNQMTLGSTAIVLRDEDDALGVYMSDSNKEWVSLLTIGGETTPAPSPVDLLHVLSSSDYDPDTHIPTVENPEMNVVYLVPSGEETGNNLFDEWIYTGDSWERFGGVPVNNTAVQADWNEDDTNSEAHILNRPNIRKGSDPTGVVEGMLQNVASGEYSHAEGNLTTAAGPGTHSEGHYTAALGNYSHVEGESSQKSGQITLTGAAQATTYKYISLPSDFSQEDAKHCYINVENQYYLVTNINEQSKEITLNKTLSANAIDSQSFDMYYTGTIASASAAHAEGFSTAALEIYAHAEGRATTASGAAAHSEGLSTRAVGGGAHAEGQFTSALGDMSHAEGSGSSSTGLSSHVEGATTSALGMSAHAEGTMTVAQGAMSHAEGFNSLGLGDLTHVEGGNTSQNITLTLTGAADATTYTYLASDNSPINLSNYFLYYYKKDLNTAPILVTAVDTANRTISFESTLSIPSISNRKYILMSGSIARGNITHAEGLSRANGELAHSEGDVTYAIGEASHVEGQYTQATGAYAHAEGQSTQVSGTAAHAEGQGTKANADGAHAEGTGTRAQGGSSHAEGSGNSNQTITVTIHDTSFIPGAEGFASHTEGYQTQVEVMAGHAEGYQTQAYNSNGIPGAHAEGYQTRARWTAHSEGNSTQASGQASHAEGTATQATSQSAHAEGVITKAQGENSHAEGYQTTASGDNSHTEGAGTEASGTCTHVFGAYNINNSPVTSSSRGTYVEIVGNGTSSSMRSNARTLDWNGNEWLAGTLTVGSDPVNNMQVATKQYVDNNKLQTVHDDSSKSATIIGNSRPVELTGGETYGLSSVSESYAYALGYGSHAEGNLSRAQGEYSHAEGSNTLAAESWSHAEGHLTKALHGTAHAEGETTYAQGYAAHAEGFQTRAIKGYAHSEGQLVIAYGSASHAEGHGQDQSGQSITITGRGASNELTYTSDEPLTMADNLFLITSDNRIRLVTSIDTTTNTITLDSPISGEAVENLPCELRQYYGAIGDYSHAEGNHTLAFGDSSHTEGSVTKTTENYAHAEGSNTSAEGESSHAEGNYTTAVGKAQHVFGEFNEIDTVINNQQSRSHYVEIVGNGEDNNSRSNARTLDWDGNETLAGSLTCANSITIGNITITEAQLQALLALLP